MPALGGQDRVQSAAAISGVRMLAAGMPQIRPKLASRAEIPAIFALDAAQIAGVLTFIIFNTYGV